MPSTLRIAAATFVLTLGACAGTPVAPDVAGAESFTGTVVSIDTSPWMYDGNAVVTVDADERGRVAVQLPARWNLCKAAPVDMDALRVGTQVRVVAGAGEEGSVVVCQDASHRLVPAD